jgi:hypothetical protein
LYRVKEGETYEFDTSLLSSKTMARKLDFSCMDRAENACQRRSVLTQSCLFDWKFSGDTFETIMDAETILSREEKGRGYHVSFANLTNKDSVLRIWNSLNLPFSVKDTNFEHAFVSNLETPTITAALHGNHITDSMAVQFVGKKIWIFLPPSTWTGLMHATYAGGAGLLKRSPPPGSPSEMYVYLSQPGDVLHFPSSWGHAVFTLEGPNFLMNFRKLHLGNFLNQPFNWLVALWELKTMDRSTTNSKFGDGVEKRVKDEQKFVPFRKLNLKVSDMYADLCEDGQRTPFDEQMLSIIDEAFARYKEGGQYIN